MSVVKLRRHERLLVAELPWLAIPHHMTMEKLDAIEREQAADDAAEALLAEREDVPPVDHRFEVAAALMIAGAALVVAAVLFGSMHVFTVAFLIGAPLAMGGVVLAAWRWADEKWEDRDDV